GEDSAPVPPTAPAAIVALFTHWAEGLGGFFGLFAIWGAVRAGALRSRVARQASLPSECPAEHAAAPGLRPLLTIYLALYALVLVRHLGTLGYLSDRHLLPLVAVSLPWAAGGVAICAWRIATWFAWPEGRARRIGIALVVLSSLA